MFSLRTIIFMLGPLLSLLLIYSSTSMALEVSGKVGFASLFFENSPQRIDLPLFDYEKQYNQQASILAEIEFYHAWNDDQDSLTFKPYGRIDQRDNERTSFDIRELMWLHVEENWELRTGISKVFWGVTEVNHLIDIINQDDQADDINGDPKLGQPMVNLSLLKEWGVVDLFILPGFRERTFPGEAGRLRSFIPVVNDQAQYESSAKEKHVDFALRWSHTIDTYDIGIYYFQGTNRDPFYIPSIDKGKAIFIPYYDQIKQLAVDLQVTQEDWLWKLEALHREDHQGQFSALTGGFEYTFVGVMESVIDVGVLSEYSWDERGDPILSQFQNDIMLGVRLGFNDAQSSELLAGFVQDLDYSHLNSFQIEASRRLGDDWKFSVDLRLFSNHELNVLGNDDHLQLTLERYF